MSDILAFFTLRTFILLFSTAFSLLAIMLILNIITVDDMVAILKLSPEAGSALRVVVERLQEVCGNVVDIISQLLNKLFSWAGVDVDLSKIKVDLNDVGHQPDPNVDPNSTPDNSGSN